MSRRPELPADTILTHDDQWWTLSFGRYHLRIRSCSCSLPPCTCKRKMGAHRRWAHHNTHCHSGHAEHMVRIIKGVTQ